MYCYILISICWTSVQENNNDVIQIKGLLITVKITNLHSIQIDLNFNIIPHIQYLGYLLEI